MNNPCRIRIKICGMTRPADALCAVEAGVDGLGFIFYDKSPRAIDPEAARGIIGSLPPLVNAVGVFVNETLERVAAVIRRCNLCSVQLHGAESPEYCRELAAIAGPCRILKAIRVGPETTAESVAPYQEVICGYLLDTYQKDLVGGTGKAFDWSLINRLALAKPFLLAGGLDLDNIREAIAHVRPYGVDANSGLEDQPGVKNHERIRAFIATIREVETSWRSSGQQ